MPPIDAESSSASQLQMRFRKSESKHSKRKFNLGFGLIDEAFYFTKNEGSSDCRNLAPIGEEPLHLQGRKTFFLMPRLSLSIYLFALSLPF